MEDHGGQHRQPEYRPAVGAELLMEFARCLPWIEAALAESPQGHTPWTVAASLADGSGRCLLWPGRKCMMVTELEGTSVNGWLAAGSLEEIALMTPCVERYAVHVGAKKATLIGRRGWERSFLRDRGYKVNNVVLAKDLEANSGGQ